MTPQEIEICRALGNVSFFPGTRTKRFAHDMAALAERDPDALLTQKQADALYKTAHRFRRQMPHRLVGLAPEDVERRVLPTKPLSARAKRLAKSRAESAALADAQAMMPLTRESPPQ